MHDRTISPPSKMTATDVARPNQIDSLHGLRFLAAFAILFSHACAWIPRIPSAEVFHRIGATVGVFGMPLFFVLSGFVIYYAYAELFSNYRKRWAFSEFIGARIARLIPLYFLMQAIGITLDSMLQWYMTGSGYLMSAFLVHASTLTQSWFYIILNNRLLSANGFGISWSISTEWFFYIIFPLVCLPLFRVRTIRFSVSLLLGFAVIAQVMFFQAYVAKEAFVAAADNVLPVTLHDGSYNVERFVFYLSPWARFFEFILGCFIAHAYMKLERFSPGPRERALGTALLVISLLGCAIIAALPWLPGSGPQFLWHVAQRTFGPTLFIAGLIFCVVRYRSVVAGFLSTPRLVALGEVSYSIYCTHYFILRPFFVGHAQWPALNAATLAITLMSIVLGIVLTLIVSFGTYAVVEVPARRWLRGVTHDVSTAVWGRKEANRLPVERSSASVAGITLVYLAGFVFLAACMIYQFIVVPMLVPFITQVQ